MATVLAAAAEEVVAGAAKVEAAAMAAEAARAAVAWKVEEAVKVQEAVRVATAATAEEAAMAAKGHDLDCASTGSSRNTPGLPCCRCCCRFRVFASALGREEPQREDGVDEYSALRDDSTLCYFCTWWLSRGHDDTERRAARCGVTYGWAESDPTLHALNRT